MNMSNTSPADIKYAKVTEHTSWQEIVPFLRTGDIVTVYNNQGAPAHNAKVWVSYKTPLIWAGAHCLRHADGALSEAVTDVFLRRAFGRADELEQLAAALKAGDVVRATFLVPQGFFAESHTITLEGPVEVDREGDGFLAVEDEDDDFVGPWYITLHGLVWPNLRALEVIDPGKGAEDAAPLTFAAYASQAAETAVYPGQGTFWGLQYVTAGLASEAGEVQGKIKKMQRDGGYTPDSTHLWGGDRADLVAELGDVAWYLAMACLEADINPNEVLARNLSKLADRAARDTIQGSGDNR